MKSLVAASASGICFALAVFSATSGSHQLQAARAPAPIPVETLTAVVRNFCADCHNPTVRDGNLSLEDFDVAHADTLADVAERVITKLRAGMMPPPHTKGTPGGDTLTQLASAIERVLDQHAQAAPEPGTRTFQRLNRAEYEQSIKDLLGLEVDAGNWLPLDTKSANFDNIADVQTPSATTLDGYLDAASEISLLAVGDPHASARTSAYKVPRLASQWEHADGAPMGTRGGVSVIHNFPADGEYIIAVSLHAIPTGQLYGSSSPFDEKVEVSVNGERVALLDVPRGMSQADPNGMEVRTPKVLVRAGPQRVTAAFVKTFEGPVNDNLAPIGASIADTDIGHQFGVTNLPHVQVMFVRGPYNPTGVSETSVRKRIFTCRPTSAEEARPCATQIITRLGSDAYRHPLTPNDLKALMAFYDRGSAQHGGGFETGIRQAIEAILASPHFIFRFEELPSGAKPGQRYALSDEDLASRLSFFLWGSPPDATLISLARDHSLSNSGVLEAQAKRMLADPRSEALGTRFAAQWLRLQDIDKVHPDALQFPNFRQQLADDMQRETELFFDSIVRENRNVLDLFSADYTFINEALAKHYGIPGVKGPEFRRVVYPDERRRGLLGQASILMLTSQANRTSPVLRGKWVMEVLLGTPPPPPPPNVPDLEKTGDSKDGRLLTTRERMEQHRANPQCYSCHQYMDPIGLALDNFDVMGQWRIRENGSPVDTRGMLYDGTPISNLAELERALMRRPTPLIRTFTQNLLVYALGRRAEYFDGPTIRKIAGDAEAKGNRAQDFILGVIKSDAFRMKSVPAEGGGTQ
jgi:hypothetical protein